MSLIFICLLGLSFAAAFDPAFMYVNQEPYQQDLRSYGQEFDEIVSDQVELLDEPILEVYPDQLELQIGNGYGNDFENQYNW